MRSATKQKCSRKQTPAVNEESTREYIVTNETTASDSDAEEETYEIVRAPTLIVISSDEVEDVMRGEIDITEEDSQRLGDGYTEYTRRVTMTMKIYDDWITHAHDLLNNM